MANIDKTTLRLFVPFSTLSDANLNELLGKVSVAQHTEGKVLFKRMDNSSDRYYLMDGSVDLCDEKYNITPVESGSEQGRHPLDNNEPHQFSAITKSTTKVLCIDKDYLDLVLTWDQAGDYLVADLAEDELQDMEYDWMSALLQSHLFTRIPPANIQQLFVKFEEKSFKAGEEVIKEGEPGDYFYVIKQGDAEVKRRQGTEDKQVATLSVGQYFGEDALIGEAPRNASVVMKSNGILMRLNQADFKTLLTEPVLSYIDYAELEKKLTQNTNKYQLVDVRLALEYKFGHLPNTINLPLNNLRKQISTLSPDEIFVTTCDSGRRSELAAHLLSQAGLQALILKKAPDIESNP